MVKKKASKKTAPAKAEKSTAVKHRHSDGTHLTKADRQKQLFSRTDSKPGEATLMRSKADRQKTLLERTNRLK